jgi:hypothetical protein
MLAYIVIAYIFFSYIQLSGADDILGESVALS